MSWIAAIDALSPTHAKFDPQSLGTRAQRRPRHGGFARYEFTHSTGAEVSRSKFNHQPSSLWHGCRGAPATHTTLGSAVVRVGANEVQLTLQIHYTGGATSRCAAHVERVALVCARPRPAKRHTTDRCCRHRAQTTSTMHVHDNQLDECSACQTCIF